MKRVDKVSGKETWKRTLLLTATLGHALLGMRNWSKKKQTVDVLESWNAVAVAEIDQSSNVIGFPGCAVFNESWAELFRGKDVNIWFDNDHPKPNKQTGKEIPPAGWTYALRNAQTLKGIARSVNLCRWGDPGYDQSLPSGYDVRDRLGVLETIKERSEAWSNLSTLLIPADGVSMPGDSEKIAGKEVKLKTVPCSSFKDLTDAWRKAFQWRKELSDALAVCLSLQLSTDQVGDQLLIMLAANAGSGKTNFCEGLLTSTSCYSLENVNGLLSGFQGGGFSPISRMNHKGWITAEGDTVVNHPAFPQFMSQIRRAYDGSLTADYKNSKDQQEFSGLRFTWILAGTPKMIDAMNDQASLGDRFLRYVIPEPAEDEKRSILKRSAYSAQRAVKISSSKDVGSQLAPELAKAYQMTGGYVDWLRKNAQLLESVELTDEQLDLCITLGEFAAGFRARPGKSKTEEPHDAKELPTRLTKQFVRVAMVLTVTLNKEQPDDDVMAIVRQMALYTSEGHTLQIARHLWNSQDDSKTVVRNYGRVPDDLAMLINRPVERIRELLKFMRTIKMFNYYNPKCPKTNAVLMTRWKMTESTLQLYKTVMVDWAKKQ